MNPWKRLVACRQRRAHERYLAERTRQQALKGQEAQDAARTVAQELGGRERWMGRPQRVPRKPAPGWWAWCSSIDSSRLRLTE